MGRTAATKAVNWLVGATRPLSEDGGIESETPQRPNYRTTPTSRRLKAVVRSLTQGNKQAENSGTLSIEESIKIDESTPSTNAAPMRMGRNGGTTSRWARPSSRSETLE